MPRFSYLHHPQGSPSDLAYRHAGVAPTGPLPPRSTFLCTAGRRAPRFEALLLADTQPENDSELGYLRDDIIAGALGCGAAFGINHGDVVFDDLALYPRYLQILGATGIPWHHCPGNHDINSEARDDATSRETWKRVFGPRHYAFQHGGATFIVLDNVHYFGHNPGKPRSGRYCGLIGEQQLPSCATCWRTCPREQLVVLSMHIPLATYQDPSNPSDNTADRLALLELLAGRPHSVSFSGHMHLTEHHYLGADGDAVAHGPITITSSRPPPAAGGAARATGAASLRPTARTATPNGYHVLSVDGAHYTTRFVPAAGKASAQLRAVVDGPHRRNTATSTHARGTGAIALAESLGVRAGRECLRRGPSNARQLRNRRAGRPSRPDAPRRGQRPLRRSPVRGACIGSEAVGARGPLIPHMESAAPRGAAARHALRHGQSGRRIRPPT